MRKVNIKTHLLGGIEYDIPVEFKPRVRWTATNRNGMVYGFQHKPFLTNISRAKGTWLCTEECIFLLKIKKRDRTIGWQDSLLSC